MRKLKAKYSEFTAEHIKQVYQYYCDVCNNESEETNDKGFRFEMFGKKKVCIKCINESKEVL